MNDEQALLRSICAEPDDDAPRLVYADWLEERGDPRADYIRAECLLAQHAAGPCMHTCGDCAQRRVRAQQLRNAHGLDWVLPLARALGVPEDPDQYKGNRFHLIGTLSCQLGERGPYVQWEW